MDASEQIKRVGEFLDKNYKKDLSKATRKGERFLVIDFSLLAEFDHELAEGLLESPEEVLKAAELAVGQFDLGEDTKRFSIRINNIPESQSILIRDIRSKHIGQLLLLEGIVRQKSDVRPQVTSAKFECPSCGKLINVLQLSTSFKEPMRCGCGRKGKFRLVSKELVDAQSLVLEECPEKLVGGEQPKRMRVFLRDDLVSPIGERKTNPGNKIIVIGQVKEVPIISKTGGTSTRYDLLVEANYIEGAEETFLELEIAPEEEKEIMILAKEAERSYGKFINSIAPSIFGHERIKEALLLQLMGGVQKERSDGIISRGDIHVLLVGDPGSGKSQLLKRVNIIAPKGRYVSGKGVSGAGLTAAVVRDEFLGGWSLEAGALVLANGGICAIDELDKMAPEDRSAMHEALEQQSYHPDTEIILSNGRTGKIGVFVDNLIRKNKKGVIKGKNCEILPVNGLRVLSTNFKKTFETNISRVSRHVAPEYFIKIEYSNGRSITVTPEHPVFVFKENIEEVRADKIKEGMFAPAPRFYNTRNKEIELRPVKVTKKHKMLFFPKKLNKRLARLLGYIATEGHTYFNKKNRYAEIGISNTDSGIICDVEDLFKQFGTKINKNLSKAEGRKKAKKDLTTVRCISVPLYSFFKKNFPELLKKASKKRMPEIIKGSLPECRKEFLRAAFKGDGFVDSERFGFSTASHNLAKDYQDLLLQHKIWSYVANDNRGGKRYYKVVVSGTPSMLEFIEEIVEKDDARSRRLHEFYKRSKNRLNYRDILPPTVPKRIDRLLKEYRLSDGYFFKIIENGQNSHKEVVQKYIGQIENRIKDIRVASTKSSRGIRRLFCIPARDVAANLNCSLSTLYNIESTNPHHPKTEKLLKTLKQLSDNKLRQTKSELNKLKQIVASDMRFVKIKKVSRVQNKKVKWVYDITVPNKVFLSEGLVLHNTVSISKANIQATLITRTTVLAAANPKIGRFDPYDVLARQIDLPPALINRFDLIFAIKDLPEKKADEALATHILSLHQKPNIREPEIPTKLLRKYIAYARQKINPKLSNEAVAEIKKYYVQTRGQVSSEESAARTIPITPRQLEAVVRLAEGAARVRLSNDVTKEDARRAIDLLHYCLLEVGLDVETGKIDIDRISTGMSATERGKIVIVREVIAELENKLGKTIPIDDIVRGASEKGLKEADIEDTIEKLRRSGDLFEPKKGFISRI